jgi:enoyl-CoA hydratase
VPQRRIHPHLVEDRRDDVALLRIEREAALGALSGSMLEALIAYTDELAADPGVRVLVLTGTGRGFIAGADIGEYHGAAQVDFDAYQRLGRRAFDSFVRLPQVAIAAVNGFALGGGFEIALCCDLIVACPEARFGLPEIKLGLLPGGGGTQRLARAVGVRMAKELVMTGRSMTAEEALSRGLLSRVVAPDDLVDEALALAEKLAGRAPLALREAKRVIDEGIEASLPAAWTLEQRVLGALFASDDAKEGIQAFADKRDPEFHGR